MKLVVQRTKYAAVRIDGDVVGEIDFGLMVLVGVTHQDTIEDAKYLVRKLSNLRIFEDEQGKMNLSIADQGLALFLVSNFTLYGDCRHGRRPSYSSAAPIEKASAIYEAFVAYAREHAPVPVYSGVFQADMQIETQLDGPVTLLLDSQKEF